MGRLTKYFFKGLVYLVPLGLTAWVFVTAFLWIDGLMGFERKGVGALILIVLITGFGFVLSNFLGATLLSWFEGVVDRLPLARALHTSTKDMMSAFVGEERRFSIPVAVELTPGVRALGFVTRESMEELGLPHLVGVYLPQAYNFAGQLLVVPRQRRQVHRGGLVDAAGEDDQVGILPAEHRPGVVQGGKHGRAEAGRLHGGVERHRGLQVVHRDQDLRGHGDKISDHLGLGGRAAAWPNPGILYALPGDDRSLSRPESTSLHW